MTIPARASALSGNCGSQSPPSAPRATRRLDADPALARVGFGDYFDMLVLALSTCDHDAVDLLLAKRCRARRRPNLVCR